MKVLLISTNADEAGAPRHVEAIVKGLESKFQFVIVFGEDGPVCSRLKQQGHIVYVINEMRTAISPFKDLIALFKVIYLINKHQPDIVHCHSAKAGMLGRLAAFINGKKWLYTVHGWGWRGATKVIRTLIIGIEKILGKLPRGFYIYVANDVKTEASNVLGLKKSRGVVVYNGVSQIPTNTLETTENLVIMMPARVSSAKDHQSLILAFEQFDCDSSRLILCGSGTDSNEFISITQNLAPKTIKNISFLGERSDMPSIYAQTHIVALISHFEALPLTIIEAMSCAKTVVATNVGGVPEIIESGVNGVLVRPGCVEDIVEAFNKFKNDHERTKIGTRAQITYLEGFTERIMLESISEIYNKM
jgi:glycosyltransferase involved in cell wall biosynthesis